MCNGPSTPGLDISASSMPAWQQTPSPSTPSNVVCAMHQNGPVLPTAALHAPAGLQVQPLLLRKAAVFVTRILVVFGISEASPGGIGFGREGSSSSSGAGDGSAPILDAFAAFRDTVRGLAREQPASGAILQACDRCAPCPGPRVHARPALRDTVQQVHAAGKLSCRPATGVPLLPGHVGEVEVAQTEVSAGWSLELSCAVAGLSVLQPVRCEVVD